MKRRRFVKTAGGIFVAAAVGEACGGDGSPTGTVRVTITGLSSGTTAGTATITGSGLSSPLVVPLPAAASGEATVLVGSYHVVYQPPAGHAMAPGSPNAVDLVVTLDSITEVSFAVVPANGLLRITVTGVTSGTNGGSAQVLRTDIGGQTAQTVSVPIGGQVDTSLVPGGYSVDYSAPSGFRLTADQTDPRSVTVTPDTTTPVTYAIEAIPAGPPPAVVFHTDWTTALGSSDAAVRDTGKTIPWDLVIGSSNPQPGRLIVVPATGLDFPSENCLQVDGVDIDSIQTRQVSVLPASDRWPIPAVGESVWFRVYKRVVYPASQPALGNNNHALEERSGNSSNWSFSFDINDNGWRPKFQSQVVNRYALSNGSSANPVYLARNVTYRLEWQIQRIAPATCNFHIRIYDSANTLLYDDSDFYIGTTQHLGQAPALTLTDPDALDAWQLGTNGPGANPDGDIVPMWYFGAAAVSRADWCGPYSQGI